MRLYEITLVNEIGDEFPVGFHSGTRGEAILKAKYSAKKLGCPVVVTDWNELDGEERMVVADIGPGSWQENYVRGAQ